MRDEMLRSRMLEAGVIRPSETFLPRVQLPRARVVISYEYGKYDAEGISCINQS